MQVAMMTRNWRWTSSRYHVKYAMRHRQGFTLVLSLVRDARFVCLRTTPYVSLCLSVSILLLMLYMSHCIVPSHTCSISDALKCWFKLLISNQASPAVRCCRYYVIGSCPCAHLCVCLKVCPKSLWVWYLKPLKGSSPYLQSWCT